MLMFIKAAIAAVIAVASATACAASMPPVQNFDRKDYAIEEPASSITRADFDWAWGQLWDDASAADNSMMCDYWRYDPAASAEAFMIGLTSTGAYAPVEWYHDNMRISCGRGA